MYDLIYLENRSDYLKAQEELKQEFPSALFEDGSEDKQEIKHSVSPEAVEHGKL